MVIAFFVLQFLRFIKNKYKFISWEYLMLIYLVYLGKVNQVISSSDLPYKDKFYLMYLY